MISIPLHHRQRANLYLILSRYSELKDFGGKWNLRMKGKKKR